MQRCYPSTRTLLVAPGLAKFAKYCQIPVVVMGPDCARGRQNICRWSARVPRTLNDCEKCVHRVSGRKGCRAHGRDFACGAGSREIREVCLDARGRNRSDFEKTEPDARIACSIVQAFRVAIPAARGIGEVFLGLNFLDTSDYASEGKILVFGSRAFREL
jgi:hypothetical protein